MANDDPLTAAQTAPRYSVGMGALYQAESEGMPPRPEFREQARPRCVDPELLALEPERQVLFHELPGLMTGCGIGRAFEVVARVEEQIARQASGFFTLAEAAHILANANAGCDVRDLIQRMMAAIVGRTAEAPKGRRLPRELGSKLPVLEGADSFTFLWVASPEDIDEWLAGTEMRAPYRFPKATEAEPPQAINRVSQTEAKEAREDARLVHCEARGLVFDKDPLRPLPYGIAEAAASLVPPITRQSLSTDVRAALRRRFDRERNGKG